MIAIEVTEFKVVIVVVFGLVATVVLVLIVTLPLRTVISIIRINSVVVFVVLFATAAPLPRTLTARRARDRRRKAVRASRVERRHRAEQEQCATWETKSHSKKSRRQKAGMIETSVPPHLFSEKLPIILVPKIIDVCEETAS